MTSANIVYAILSTLKDIEDSAPNGLIYAAMMGKVSHSSYSGIITRLVQAKLIKVSNNLVSITEMGKELVSKVDSELQRKPD
jgi:predicted transcriptional regulator